MQPLSNSDLRQLQDKAEREWRALKESQMDSPHFDNALHIMEVRGGSFVKSLANCYYSADSGNKAKLREAFAEYFENYEEQFRHWKASRQAEAT